MEENFLDSIAGSRHDGSSLALLVVRYAWLFILTQFLYAQGQSPPNAPQPISTDRPAITDSSVVVPKESLQIENGFLETRALGQQSFDLPESLFRLGVAEKTELRFTAPDYYQNFYSGSSFVSGWSDVLLGVKQQLGPVQGFDISLVVSLSLPSGSHSVSSHGYDPEIQLPWSRKLSANWTAAGMLSVYWPTQNGSRNTMGQAAFLFDRQLKNPWDAFIEYVGEFPQRGGPEYILHFGTAFKLTPQQQVDFHLGVGLSSAAPDHFVGIGYSLFINGLR